ncbi:hypothetical protein QFC21_000527 [Naganishia friedmannii]|uniref:Uncharacterized protein n=1 Tax=Naganishia friedmannii TaxID=89922 RepID=A0ACC2WCJ9_9TREE|nr:hypothetical protein QFC21_000527 [Naganishia friedmannii]
MTKFLPAWIRNNFRLSTGQPVKNKDMIVHLLALLNQRDQSNKVKFLHVKAHVGETGNEGADVLANTGASIHDIPPDRTDWFTLEDANRFKTGHFDRPSSSRKSATISLPNTISHVNADLDSEAGSSAKTLQDIAPAEVEVDPSWLLTEEDIAELEADA